jgi:hypothetical protein
MFDLAQHEVLPCFQVQQGIQKAYALRIKMLLSFDFVYVIFIVGKLDHEIVLISFIDGRRRCSFL